MPTSRAINTDGHIHDTGPLAPSCREVENGPAMLPVEYRRFMKSPVPGGQLSASSNCLRYAQIS